MDNNFFILSEKFKEVCLKFPGRIAVKSPVASFTFGEVYGLSLKTASFLIQEGINKGDKAAIILENCPQWLSIYFGILFSGGVCVPLDPHVNSGDIENFLKDCTAKFAFIAQKQSGSFGRVLQNLHFIKKIIVLDGEDESGKFFNFEKIKNSDASDFFSPEIHLDDVASILYTSGTTAIPKGVALTHKNFSANFNSIKKLNLCGEKDIFLSVLPFYHAYAFMATLVLPIFLGAKIVFPSSLKARDLTNSLREESVTMLVAVPELFSNLHNAIFQEIKQQRFLIRILLSKILSFNFWLRKIFRINCARLFFGKIHLKVGRKLRFLVSGGARLEPKIAVDLFKLGFTVLEGYGLSETSPIVTLNPASRQKFGSVGIALPGVRIKIINPGRDGVGEVAIKGENVFNSYYGNFKETQKAIKDGWFYSGDLGFLDKKGHLYLTGRSKEVIVLSSGKNIYPEEIEEYYKKTHVVKELCVVEVKDERGIAGLQAVVVPNFEYFKIAEGGNIFRKIKWEFENISQALPTYKRISGFILTKDDLPRTTLGKIKRYEVKEKYLKAFSEKERFPEEKREILEEDFKLLSSSLAGKIVEFFKNTLSLKKEPNLDDHLEIDLGLDSLAKVELIAGLEKLFSITIPDAVAQEITSVREAIVKLRDLVSGRTGDDFKDKEIEPSWKELLLIDPTDEVKDKIELHPSAFNKVLSLVLNKSLFLIFKLFFDFKVEGAKNIPKEENFIFCANHASYLDGFALAAALPYSIAINLYFIGWKQILEHPSVKWANKICRLVPIDSSSDLMSTMQIAGFILRNNKHICIFPEGQRTIDGKIQEFRKGLGILVNELDIPLIPVAIKGTFEAWPRTKKILRLHPIKVVFGKPITIEELLNKIPKGAERNYELISSRIREEVEKLF